MGEANWANRTLFHGDNLAFLRGMNSESVDLIATDPPFNKGRDFHATPDSLAAGAKFQDRWSWERDVHVEWTDQITDDHPRLMEAIESARYAHSDGMGAFMCFMAVRLLEMQRILSLTGSIYLHCDPTASHYLKAVMDAIFGWRNFRNEIVWAYRGREMHIRTKFNAKHDVVLLYATSKAAIVRMDQVAIPYDRAAKIKDLRRKIHTDEDGQEWVWETRGQAAGQKPYRRYVDEIVGQGRPLNDVWDFQFLRGNHPERLGYPTQKPLALYERMIRASSDAGDIVLDPFAGCATTCVAAERLGRQWVGMDIWERAHATVVRRMKEQAVGIWGQVHYATAPPHRTDGSDHAAPFLRVKQRVTEPDGPRWSRARMYEFLLDQHGQRCMGCDRRFDDSRYLELDHNTPRSDGGLNHVSNRILLCGPCNRLKSNRFTLSGLRRENKKLGYMAG